MPEFCEACEKAAVQTVESCDDPNEPYHLCAACHHRLHARALRPLEWYNLAKRHGWHRFLLHDDFYNEQGAASQPDEPVERSNDLPIPSLVEVAHQPRRLLDYSITRWSFDSDLATRWTVLPRQEILNALSERFGSTGNVKIRSRVLEICAFTLAESGAAFVRHAWDEYSVPVSLPALAQASAACLPFREGFDRVADALAKLVCSQKRNSMWSLGYFHSPEALDWIEEHIFAPTTDAWGHLAAASRLDWPRVENWLSRGRPLSLVAIDALAAIVRPRSALLRAYGPRLHDPPTSDRFGQVLSAYAACDPVPRVRQRIAELISHSDALTTGS